MKTKTGDRVPVYVLTVAHEDPYNVDPERPRVFDSPEAADRYMQGRGFTPTQHGLRLDGSQTFHADHWEREDSEGFVTSGALHPAGVRS